MLKNDVQECPPALRRTISSKSQQSSDGLRTHEDLVKQLCLFVYSLCSSEVCNIHGDTKVFENSGSVLLVLVLYAKFSAKV